MSIKQETEDYYFDLNGKLTYKAESHLARGECCFNYCLHCPYGTTVEKYGLKACQSAESVLKFSLKGSICAYYFENEKRWEILPRFQTQSLEDDLNLSLRIFYIDKGEQ